MRPPRAVEGFADRMHRRRCAALPGPVAASQWETARVVARFHPYPHRSEHEGLVLVGTQIWIDYPDSVPRSDAALEADDFE